MIWLNIVDWQRRRRMAKRVKQFLRYIYPSWLLEKKESRGSTAYSQVQNEDDSSGEETVHQREKMTKKTKNDESPQRTSALQAAWNVSNLIQGRNPYLSEFVYHQISTIKFQICFFFFVACSRFLSTFCRDDQLNSLFS